MVNCDICGKDINTIKDPHHEIPYPVEGRQPNLVMVFMCDNCYQKFRDDLKRMEEYEE